MYSVRFRGFRAFHDTGLVNRTETGKPVLSWLLKGSRAGLVVGGKNLEEVAISSSRSTLTVLK